MLDRKRKRNTQSPAHTHAHTRAVYHVVVRRLGRRRRPAAAGVVGRRHQLACGAENRVKSTAAAHEVKRVKPSADLRPRRMGVHAPAPAALTSQTHVMQYCHGAEPLGHRRHQAGRPSPSGRPASAPAACRAAAVGRWALPVLLDQVALRRSARRAQSALAARRAASASGRRPQGLRS